MIEQIKKTREYLNYLEEHYNNVQKAWEIIKLKCNDMYFMADDFRYFSIQEAVEAHDLSKMSCSEFVQYREKFFPTEFEKKNFKNHNDVDSRFEKAWKHHIKENPHHHENWKEIAGFPAIEIHVIHNIIDWMAMGMKFGDTAQEYYERNKDELDFPEWASDFAYAVFNRLK